MRKIHITEAQLAYCVKKLHEAYTVDATSELEQTGNNAKTVANNLMAKNPNLKNDADRGEANISFNPEALSENCFNEEGDSEDYRIVLSYLEDIQGTPEFYRLINSIEGNIDEEEFAIQELCNKLGVRKISVYSAIREFQKEMNGNYNRYAMEGKLFTKKQIKEAKLENLKKSCTIIKKKDI